jgi:hypothetical protein
MTYTELDTSTAFLDSLARFRPPADAKLKEINW